MGAVKMRAKEKEKRNKIVFSEEIDSTINGYALGVSFVGIGIFLLIKPDYFQYEIASYIAGAVIGLFGLFGVGTELSKHSEIKGVDNLALGVFALIIWLLVYLNTNSLWWNIPAFLVFVFGCYGCAQGMIQGIYSIVHNTKARKKETNRFNYWETITQIILFLTEICGLAVAIMNVIQAIKI